MLDCIMKKGREVFLNINEFQHLGLPEVSTSGFQSKCLGAAHVRS